MHVSGLVYLISFELHWPPTDIPLESTCSGLLVHGVHPSVVHEGELASITPKYESITVALWRNGEEARASCVISGSIPAK